MQNAAQLKQSAGPYHLNDWTRLPRTIGKEMLCRILEWQVVRLRAKYKFKIVAVAGSIGKTSTKLAIAHTLAASKTVVYQDGNYNDRVTVPLVLFGHSLPGLLNVIAWSKIVIANEQTIRRGYRCDVAVLELGTDGPGQISKFAYLHPDIVIVTAVTPEHMAFFKTLDAVAAEELAVINYSDTTIINSDDTPHEYLRNDNIKTYGKSASASYRIVQSQTNALSGLTLQLSFGDNADASETFSSPMLGAAGAKITAAAIAVAYELGISHDVIRSSLLNLPPVPGRMQILAGLHDSIIIDDTYNASPAPVIAGLDVLAQTPATRRIAILGSMNELGNYSQQAHEEVGAHCSPKYLNLVVTIGEDAKKYLAPRAASNGCQVESFSSPYDAGEYLKKELTSGTAVLAEGSQNGVFAEEAIKLLLKDPADGAKLVRQSAYWLGIKQSQFKL